MKATLLAGLCLVLVGVIVGLASPRGSLTKPFEGVLGGTPSESNREAPPSDPPAPVEPVSAPFAPMDEPAADASAASPAYEQAGLTNAASQGSKQPADQCTKLTEAAQTGYMSAGYATQDFALASIKAKEGKVSQAALLTARDQYQAALRSARAQIAAASHAQCWSRTGTTPPDIEAFQTSLPNAALAALGH